MSTMNLSTEMIEQFMAKLATIDARMAEQTGTLSQRKAEVVEQLTLAELPLVANIPTDGIERPYLPVHNLASASARLEAAKAAHDEAKQALDDAIVAALKAKKSDTGAELTSLKAERDELVTTINAMSTLLKVTVEIPKAPKGSGSNGSGTPRAKSSTGAHYVKADDGSTSSYANDTFSGLAFYAFKRAGVADLKAALAGAGVTDLTVPWEATVTVNGITRTIGHSVTPTEG